MVVVGGNNSSALSTMYSNTTSWDRSRNPQSPRKIMFISWSVKRASFQSGPVDQDEEQYVQLAFTDCIRQRNEQASSGKFISA